MSLPRTVEQDVLACEKKDFLNMFSLPEHIGSFRTQFIRTGKVKAQNYAFIVSADYAKTAPCECTDSGGSIMIKIHGDEEAQSFVLAMCKRIRDFGYFICPS